MKLIAEVENLLTFDQWTDFKLKTYFFFKYE